MESGTALCEQTGPPDELPKDNQSHGDVLSSSCRSSEQYQQQAQQSSKVRVEQACLQSADACPPYIETYDSWPMAHMHAFTANKGATE